MVYICGVEVDTVSEEARFSNLVVKSGHEERIFAGLLQINKWLSELVPVLISLP